MLETHIIVMAVLYLRVIADSERTACSSRLAHQIRPALVWSITVEVETERAAVTDKARKHDVRQEGHGKWDSALENWSQKVRVKMVLQKALVSGHISEGYQRLWAEDAAEKTTLPVQVASMQMGRITG
jgi:hypothetical protein